MKVGGCGINAASMTIPLDTAIKKTRDWRLNIFLIVKTRTILTMPATIKYKNDTQRPGKVFDDPVPTLHMCSFYPLHMHFAVIYEESIVKIRYLLI